MRFHSIGAFLYGFVGSVIFMVPVLWLLSLSLRQEVFLAILVPFTIVWYWLWTWVGHRLHFYTDGIIPYSVGGGLGLIVTLYYGAAIFGLFGVA